MFLLVLMCVLYLSGMSVLFIGANKTRLQMWVIQWWLKHRRLTALVIWFCETVLLGNRHVSIDITFENRFDLKTFREVFFNKEYSLKVPGVRTIVDLGSNVGYSVAYLYLQHPQARIWAVEPASEPYRRLINLENKRITTFKLAVADKDGIFNLHIAKGSPGSSLFEREGEVGTEPVYGVTLTTLLRGFDEVDVLKIDIEGAEKYALKDPAALKARYIIAEIHPDLTGEPTETTIESLLPHFECKLFKRPSGRFMLRAQKRPATT